MRHIFILFVLISCSNNNNLHLSNLDLLDDNLDDAHNSMMSFLKEFSYVFPFDNYQMSKEKYKNMSDEELKDVNDKLKSFQDKIIVVSEKFSSSKQRASRMLN